MSIFSTVTPCKDTLKFENALLMHIQDGTNTQYCIIFSKLVYSILDESWHESKVLYHVLRGRMQEAVSTQKTRKSCCQTLKDWQESKDAPWGVFPFYEWTRVPIFSPFKAWVSAV
jgi:hypothetical protein